MRKLLPFIIVLIGFALAGALIVTGPTVQSRPVAALAPLVRVLEVQPRSVRLVTKTNGTVVPRTESELTPEVSGRVISVSSSMVSGGFFKAGDELLRIDSLDYEVALEEARARLARSESDLVNANKAHERQMDLARKQSASASQKDDALNRLKIADATLRESVARLSRAKRDLDRTKILAPYDGRVRSEKVDAGQFVNRGVSIATIYATDFAEVKLPIHDDELEFLSTAIVNPEKSLHQTKVTLRARFAGAEHEWQGVVARTEGELDPKTRMVNIIARVASPYAQQGSRPPLAIGLFVEAEIYGAQLDNIVVLPRSALHDNDTVYLVDANGKLEIRQVQVRRIVEDEIYVEAGLMAGERVCVSSLANPVRGMKLRLQAPVINTADNTNNASNGL